jgi:hypothetical protein
MGVKFKKKNRFEKIIATNNFFLFPMIPGVSHQEKKTKKKLSLETHICS